MTRDEVIFPFANWKSPYLIFPLLSLSIIGCFLVVMGLVNGDNGTFYLGGAFFLLLLVFCFFLFGTKIKIGSRGIEYSSIFKTAFIGWKDVRSIGGYIATEYSNLETDLSDLYKSSFWGQKFFFLSTEEVNYVKWGQKISDKLIYFHFRPELIELITVHLKNNSNSLASLIEKKLPPTSVQIKAG